MSDGYVSGRLVSVRACGGSNGGTNRFDRRAARRRAVIGAVACAVAAVAAGRASAADKAWNGFAGAAGTFNLGTNWTPAGAPGAADKATIASGTDSDIEVVTLTANASAAQLGLSKGARLYGNGFNLGVSGSLTANGGNTYVVAPLNSSISAGSVALSGGARVIVQGGSITGTSGFTVGSGSILQGNGDVYAPGGLVNQGSIVVDAAQMLVHNGYADADLGQAFTSVDIAAGARLRTDGYVKAYNGAMTVGAGGSLYVGLGHLELGASSVVTLNGGATEQGEAGLLMAAGLTKCYGKVVVNGFGRIDTPIIYDGARFQINANATLTTNSAPYHGGTFTGPGTYRVLAASVGFSGETHVDVGTFLWDGDSAFVQKTNVDEGGVLSINAGRISLTPTTDGYDGELELVGGKVLVDTTAKSWRLDNKLYLRNGKTDAAAKPTVGGGDRMDVYGAVTVADASGTAGVNAVFDAPVRFMPNSTLSITHAGSVLTANGRLTFAGGTYAGAGTLRINGDATVSAATLLDSVAKIDWDGDEGGQVNLFTVDANFTLKVAQIDSSPSGGYDDYVQVNGKTLTVQTAAPWRLDGDLALNNTGSPAQLLGSGLIVAGGVHAGGAGNSSIGVPVEFGSASHIGVDAGATLELLGATTFKGGIHQGVGALVLSGPTTVAASTKLAFGTVDLDGTGGATVLTVSPGAALTVYADAIDSGNGGGAFDGTLNVNDAVLSVNVPGGWRMAGTMNVTDAAGGPTAIVGGSRLDLSGKLNVAGSPLFTAPLHNAGGGTVDVSFGNSLAVVNGFSSAGGATLTKTGTGTLALGGPQSHAAGSKLVVNGGAVRLDSDAGAGGANLTVDLHANGTAATFGSTQRLAGLILTSGATASVLPGADKVLVTNQLSFVGAFNAPLATLDLADNALIVDYAAGAASPLAAVRSQILAGRANGTWAGNGITSSSAAATSGRALGYAEAAAIVGAGGGTWAGQPVDGSAVLVRYTLAGDATLDGVVDFSDLVRLAQNYNAAGGQTWGGGDFTYDGTVNFEDLVLLAQNYNSALPWSGGAALPAGAPGDFAADAAAAFSSVPEPGLTGLCAAALAMGAGGRRRRRQRLN